MSALPLLLATLPPLTPRRAFLAGLLVAKWDYISQPALTLATRLLAILDDLRQTNRLNDIQMHLLIGQLMTCTGPQASLVLKQLDEFIRFEQDSSCAQFVSRLIETCKGDSVDLASALQREHEKLSCIKSQKKQDEVSCSVCEQDLYNKEFAPLDCGHVFHKECVLKHFEFCVGEQRLPVPCPEQGCKKTVGEQELLGLLDKPMMDRFRTITLNKFATQTKDVNWCPTAGCGFFFINQNAITQFQCPSCSRHYCLNCKAPAHPNLSCQEFLQTLDKQKHDSLFINFVKGQQFKACPNCKFWVQRTEGCPKMTCRCGHFFCYDCGRPLQTAHGRCQCEQPLFRVARFVEQGLRRMLRKQ